MIGDTWSQIESIRTLKYFLSYYFKHKERVHQLDFIGEFLQANVKDIVYVKLYRRYGDYFPEYCKYFVIPLILKKSMYGMNNYGIFYDDITHRMMDVSDFKNS